MLGGGNGDLCTRLGSAELGCGVGNGGPCMAVSLGGLITCLLDSVGEFVTLYFF